MALNGFDLLKGHHNLRHTMGLDATNSDATLAIDGFENMFIKCKAFPDPNSGIAHNVEVALPLGNKYDKAGQRVTAFNGSATFIETEDRAVQSMLDQIIANGGYFDAWLYQGSPEYYVNRKRLVKCFFVQTAPTQRDFSSNTEILLIEGDLYGNYFGEIEEGNASTLVGKF